MGSALVSRVLAAQNDYLALLPNEHFQMLASSMRLLELRRSDAGRSRPALPDGFIFPLDCVIALERTVGDGETGFIRFVGPSELMRVDEVSGNRASRVVRAGCVVVVGYEPFIAFASRFASWPVSAIEFVQARNALALLNSVCYANHSYRQRVARFLLEAQDTFPGAGEIAFSHRDIATLCATRRETVTQVMHELNRADAICYGRARVRVADPVRLEQLACPCYREQRVIARYARDLARGLFPPEVGRAPPTHAAAAS